MKLTNNIIIDVIIYGDMCIDSFKGNIPGQYHSSCSGIQTFQKLFEYFLFAFHEECIRCFSREFVRCLNCNIFFIFVIDS